MAAEELVQQPQGTPEEEKRGRSTIEFPYGDLDDAVAVAKGVHSRGGSSCEWDQLAAQLNQAATSGGFRQRLLTAKTFGLVTYSQGTITLTPLGTRICDPQQEAVARVESFLMVPLYRAVHEQFRGVTLPPAGGLETAMVTLGVAVKQKEKARQVFQRAATQAGFFAHGPNRLVSPSIRTPEFKPAADLKPPGDDPNKGGGGGDGGGQLHALIQGLIQKLPPTDKAWGLESRRKWLQTASHIFDLIYPEDQEQRSLKIEIHKDSAQ